MKPTWLDEAVSAIDEAMLHAARARQAHLTKPPGSLGRLESLGIRFAAMQGTQQPQLDKVRIVVFAADHGIAEEGVSAFPQAVTVEMIRNFSRGGAAISVLARQWGAELEVVDVGAVLNPGPLPGVLSQRIAPGSANFLRQPAMTHEQLHTAMEIGRDAARRSLEEGMKLFIGGEMGIANTTVATAVACALLDEPGATLAGPGTGLDANGVRHKAEVVDQALALHQASLGDALDILRCVGGFEIAALAGAYLSCAQLGLPVLVDGFITSVAALVAVQINPAVAEWLFYSHASAEPGHSRILTALEAEPLLDLGMRLGEGSGAATALPLLRAAVALHGEMATFEEAGVPTAG